jgi:hypothetical protein
MLQSTCAAPGQGGGCSVVKSIPCGRFGRSLRLTNCRILREAINELNQTEKHQSIANHKNKDIPTTSGQEEERGVGESGRTITKSDVLRIPNTLAHDNTGHGQALTLKNTPTAHILDSRPLVIVRTIYALIFHFP